MMSLMWLKKIVPNRAALTVEAMKVKGIKLRNVKPKFQKFVLEESMHGFPHMILLSLKKLKFNSNTDKKRNGFL